MSIVGSLPYTISNGNAIDATPVQANFNWLMNQVNANAATAGANSNITSLTGLTTPLTTQQGGTGVNSALGFLGLGGGTMSVGIISPQADLFVTSSCNATAGATYTNNGSTFTVVTTVSSSTSLQTTGGAGAPAASGTLTKASGTGDSTIAFSSFTQNGGFTGNLIGNVTGNVTGNVSGSSGSCTGNAATVTNGIYTTTIGSQSVNYANSAGSASSVPASGVGAGTAGISISGSSASCTGAAASNVLKDINASQGVGMIALMTVSLTTVASLGTASYPSITSYSWTTAGVAVMPAGTWRNLSNSTAQSGDTAPFQRIA